MASRNWTSSQKEAIYKEAGNILVSASAGSGKTAVLVERVINKVINKQVDIDKILVVTFTNAAASELKERLLDSIYKKLKEEPKNTFLKRQVTLLNRASITTIHSFCLDLIRSNFDILDIDPAFSIGDESVINILKAKAISKILDKEYAKKEEGEDLSFGIFKVLELFSGKDEDFSKYILMLYSYIQSFEYPFSWLENQIKIYDIKENIDLYNTEFGCEIYSQVINELKLVCKKIEILKNDIYQNEEFEKHYNMLNNDLEQIESCINSTNNSWDLLYERLANVTFMKMPTYRGANVELKEKIATFRKKIIKESIEKAKKSIYAPSSKIIEDNKIACTYLRYIQDILMSFHSEYTELKKHDAIIDFNDIEHLALELLVTKSSNGKILPTQIADNLREKYVEIYTDEYQDTSYIQEAILEAVSGSRNRFMVGDIKQSIYKFRQAMPEIFNLKYMAYEKSSSGAEENVELDKNIKIELASNFRSRKEVLNSINYIFEKIMTNEVGDCDYSGDQTLKIGNPNMASLDTNNYKTQINILDFKEDAKAEELEQEDTTSYINELKKFEVEAHLVAREIKELVKDFKVYNLKEDSFANASYKDIVILLRSIKDSGSCLENILKKEGIPAFCDASSNIFEGEEVKLVLSFLRILDNPYQDIHLVSIMYSIIGGFDLDELVYIRNTNPKDYLYNNVLDTKEILESKENLSKFETDILNKIKDFIVTIDKFHRYSKIYDISDLLTKLYKETNIYLQFLADNMPLYRKANLDLLIELAIKFQNNTSYTLSSYISYIDSLKDKADASTSSAKILGENEDVVRIMTIHKSKGLEFPIVFLCDSSKKYNLRDSVSTITMHHKLGLGINIVNEEQNVTYPSVIKQAIKQRVNDETKSEELRMLYVALTRAKEKLIIYSSVPDYEKKKEKELVILNDDGKIEPQLVRNSTSYFDSILQVVKLYEEDLASQGIFDINVIRVKQDDFLKDNIKNTETSKRSSVEERRVKLSEEYSKYIDAIKKEKYTLLLEKNLDTKYKYEEEKDIKQRVSVSSLKKEESGGVDILFDFEESKENKRVPLAINTGSGYSPVRKGILIHFILEHLDFSKEYNKISLGEYITELVNKKVITVDDKKYINIPKIINFLNSDIGKELIDAKKIFREEEFILKSNSFTKSVIQGVIDLYYITKDDKLVLVDFKTDKNKEKDYYIEKYKKQLDIYKEAIEVLTNKKVDKTYIYSFELSSKIEL